METRAQKVLEVAQAINRLHADAGLQSYEANCAESIAYQLRHVSECAVLAGAAAVGDSPASPDSELWKGVGD